MTVKKSFKNKSSLLLCFILLLTFSSNAQNLPSEQRKNLFISSNIKIDGKVSDWNNQFQAYNRATDLFYTMANDNENLFLSIKATKPRIVEKIIAVGVTLNISNGDKNAEKFNATKTITFPILSVSDGGIIISASGIKTFNATIKTHGSTNDMPIVIKQSDSLVNIANTLLANKAKNIKVTGINEISDTLISVYNQYRIKAAAAFDNEGAYVYELAVPLKYLGLSSTQLQKFKYTIQLKSRLEDLKKGTQMVYRYSADGSQIDANIDLDSTTDFNGEYTLAKKP